jgi:NAD(P)-dependent dehydrogenase (short-subunit alcohol dehydrogenase family)
MELPRRCSPGGGPGARAPLDHSCLPRFIPNGCRRRSARQRNPGRTAGPTRKAVEALDRRIVAAQADVRDYAALKGALDDGVAQLGRLDIVSANAGISSVGTA